MKTISEDLLVDPMHGQILRDSAFGKALTELARLATNIVEIGTWRGLGSTYCISLGLERPDQRFWTIDLARDKRDEASSYYDDPRITFLWGTLVLPREVPPFDYPDPSFKQYYDIEVDQNKAAPYVLPALPKKIDLLLIDGGAWSGGVEFRKLAPRSRTIALDDTNPKIEVKNAANRQQCIDEGWTVLHDHLDERNGWAIFERP